MDCCFLLRSQEAFDRAVAAAETSSSSSSSFSNVEVLHIEFDGDVQLETLTALLNKAPNLLFLGVRANLIGSREDYRDFAASLANQHKLQTIYIEQYYSIQAESRYSEKDDLMKPVYVSIARLPCIEKIFATLTPSAFQEFAANLPTNNSIKYIYFRLSLLDEQSMGFFDGFLQKMPHLQDFRFSCYDLDHPSYLLPTMQSIKNDILCHNFDLTLVRINSHERAFNGDDAGEVNAMKRKIKFLCKTNRLGRKKLIRQEQGNLTEQEQSEILGNIFIAALGDDDMTSPIDATNNVHDILQNTPDLVSILCRNQKITTDMKVEVETEMEAKVNHAASEAALATKDMSIAALLERENEKTDQSNTASFNPSTKTAAGKRKDSSSTNSDTNKKGRGH